MCNNDKSVENMNNEYFEVSHEYTRILEKFIAAAEEDDQSRRIAHLICLCEYEECVFNYVTDNEWIVLVSLASNYIASNKKRYWERFLKALKMKMKMNICL